MRFVPLGRVRQCTIAELLVFKIQKVELFVFRTSYALLNC